MIMSAGTFTLPWGRTGRSPATFVTSICPVAGILSLTSGVEISSWNFLRFITCMVSVLSGRASEFQTGLFPGSELQIPWAQHWRESKSAGFFWFKNHADWQQETDQGLWDSSFPLLPLTWERTDTPSPWFFSFLSITKKKKKTQPIILTKDVWTGSSIESAGSHGICRRPVPCLSVFSAFVPYHLNINMFNIISAILHPGPRQ